VAGLSRLWHHCVTWWWVRKLFRRKKSVCMNVVRNFNGKQWKGCDGRVSMLYCLWWPVAGKPRVYIYKTQWCGLVALQRGIAGGDDHHSQRATERDPLAVTPETPALLALVVSAFVFVFSLFFCWRDWTFPLHTRRVGTAQVPLPPTHLNCHSLQSPVSHLQCPSPLPHAVFGFYLHSKTIQPYRLGPCLYTRKFFFSCLIKYFNIT